jgi:microcystin-dependent protein
MIMKRTILMVTLLLSLGYSNTVFSQEAMIGEIKMFAGNFAPRGWAFCDGQKLSISSNTALFSLLGTTYGGDGRTTFALPDLRGRAPVHAGKSPYLNEVRLGQMGGVEALELRRINVLKEETEETYETYSVKTSDSKIQTRSPYLGVKYIIALVGIYPSRS